jgi:hypothetical protein
MISLLVVPASACSPASPLTCLGLHLKLPKPTWSFIVNSEFNEGNLCVDACFSTLLRQSVVTLLD